MEPPDQAIDGFGLVEAMPTLPSFPGAVHRSVSLLVVETLVLRSVTAAGGVASGFGLVSPPLLQPTRNTVTIAKGMSRFCFKARPSMVLPISWLFACPGKMRRAQNHW